MLGLFVGTAQAVHDTGLFQLDGDAQAATQPPTPAPQNLEDWDNICKANLYTGTASTRQVGTSCQVAPGVTLPSGSTIADSSTFVQDGVNSGSDNIYKGGTDDADISSWLWKQAKPSPPKDDIQNAFSAIYTCDQAKVTANQCPSRYLGHKFVMFGGARYANNGNTNLGFWFMHNKVGTGGTGTNATTGACSSQSGCGFTGSHTAGNCGLLGAPDPCTPGDLFVFSAFTIGGAQPGIQVYEWVGAGNATNSPTNANSLQLIGGSGSNAAACDTSGSISGDAFCAIVNQSTIQSPWLFTGASNTLAANNIDQFEFFEGGIDLTQLGFGSECISTFLLNTRSSGSSVNSVAQDFALGQLGGCESHIQTTAGLNAAGTSISSASNSTNGTASSGTDSATVTVTGITQWSGAVDFYLCGPIATGTCDANGVKANGTLGNVGVAVSNSSPTVSSGSATLTSAGRYCWYSVFTPSTDSTNAGVDSATDNGSGRTATGTPTDPNPECFTVSPVTPTLTTHASDAAGNASSDPVAFGNPVYDTATLSGAAKEPGSDGGNTTYPTINATNGAFAGAITFTLKGPSTSGCGVTATGPTQTTTNPSSAVSVTGNTTYGPVGFTPGSPGTYHWQATYANTSAVNNSLPVTDNGSCNQSREDVVVQQIPTGISTAPREFPQDYATITSSATGDNLPTGGTVTFYLYGPAGTNTGLQNCQAHGTTLNSGGLVYTQTISNVGGTHSATVNTTNTTFYFNSSNNGTYYWRVTYSTGDQAHTGSQSDCVENVAVTTVGDSGSTTVFP